MPVGLVINTSWLSKISGKLDFDLIDQIIVDGGAKIANLLGLALKKVQSGKIQNYLLYVTASVIVLMIIQSF